MKYRLSIGFVSGNIGMDSFHETPEQVLEILKQYDHEGSSVSIDIEADGEEVYKLLGWIMEGETK